MSESTCDLLIVGGGFSGSRLLVDLIARLGLAGRAPSRAVEVTMIDRLGAFGGGVPYGPASDPAFLLIEPVASSTPPDFREWLRRHRFSTSTSRSV